MKISLHDFWFITSDYALGERICKLVEASLIYKVQVLANTEDILRGHGGRPIAILLDGRTDGLSVLHYLLHEAFPQSEQIVLQIGSTLAANPDELQRATIIPLNDKNLHSILKIMQLAIDRLRSNYVRVAMKKIISQIGFAKNISEVMQITCQTVVDLFDVDHCGFVQFDDDQSHGWAMAEYPTIGSTGSLIPVDGIPAEEQIVKEGKYFISLDVRKDRRLGEVRDHLLGKNIEAILILPVRVGSQVTASFSLDMIGRTGKFEPELIDLCLTLAEQVGMALNNVRRQQEIAFLRTSASAIQEVTRQSAQGNLRDTLQAIVDLARRDLEVEVATLYTFDHERDKFLTFVGSGLSEDNFAHPRNITKKSSLYRVLACDTYQKTEDASKDPIFHGAFVDKEHIQSSFAMKLVSGGDPVGVMFMNYRQVHHFKDDEIKTFVQFGNQAAVLIHNQKLQAQVRKKLIALEGLYQAGQNPGEYDLEHGLERIAHEALSVVGIDGEEIGGISHIAVLENNELVFKVASDSEVLKGLISKFGRINLQSANGPIGIVGRAVLENRTLNIGNVHNDLKYKQHYIEYGNDIKSQLTVLLSVGGRVYGTLTVESTEAQAFSDEAVQNLQHLASHVETIIQNSRHFSMIRSIIDAGSYMTSVKRLSSVLQVIADRLRELFSCSLVSIYTYNHETQEISYPSIISGELSFPEKQLNPHLSNPSNRVRLDQLDKPSVLQELLKLGKAYFVRENAATDEVLQIGTFAEREKFEAVVALPLFLKQEAQHICVGFLFLNFDKKRPFLQEEQNEILVFANMIAQSILYYRQYDELLETRARVGGENFMAWANYFSKTWQQYTREQALEIKTNTALVKQQLAMIDNHEASYVINTHLARIRAGANRIYHNTQPPQLSEPIKADCRIDRLLSQLLITYRKKQELGVKIKFKKSEQPCLIVADPDWLRHGFENMIEYSIESMLEEQVKQIEVSVQKLTGEVLVTITDTSHRTNPCNASVRSMSHSDMEDAIRVRLLTAKAVFALYGGAVTCINSTAGHTVFDIRFPLQSVN